MAYPPRGFGPPWYRELPEDSARHADELLAYADSRGQGAWLRGIYDPWSLVRTPFHPETFDVQEAKRRRFEITDDRAVAGASTPAGAGPAAAPTTQLTPPVPVPRRPVLPKPSKAPHLLQQATETTAPEALAPAQGAAEVAIEASERRQPWAPAAEAPTETTQPSPPHPIPRLIPRKVPWSKAPWRPSWFSENGEPMR